MTGFARVLELEAEDRDVARDAFINGPLRAAVKHMLEHPYNFDWTVQGFGMMRAYLRVCPYGESEPEHRYSKAVRAYTEDLVRAGLLTPREPDTDDVSEHIRNTACYAPTDGLRMWVDALTDVPLPKLREAWTHPTLAPRAI